MSDTDFYHWSEVPAGPLGLFARGVRSTDGTPVVARSLPDAPRSDAQSRLLADAEWSIHLGPQIAIQPLQVPAGEEYPRLILAPGNFLPLSTRTTPRLPVIDAVRLGRATAVALARLHAKGFVHGALCPQSLWVDGDFGDARLAALDLCFTDAGPLQRQPQPSQRHDLRYLAPELSTPGSPADRRADLYALGVILHEALAGRVPFDSVDSVALHHAHSAVEPEPLDRLRSDVPHALSRLVATLLAKEPADRYQSASGLRRDLERMLAAWNDRDASATDLAAQSLRDTPARPSALCGREREIEAVREIFAARSRGVFGLVTGTSGSGKSTLLDRVTDTLTEDWLVGRGACDQLGQEPFAALRAPLESILSGIEASGESSRARFAEAVSATLAGSGSVLRHILPGIERYVEASSPGPRLSAQAGERRLHAAFHALLAALASLGRPVAIVLDDVQWADAATLAVLRSMALSSTPPPITLVLLCRAEEIDTNPELADAIRTIGAHPSLAVKLEIRPLGRREVRALIAHCLDAEEEEIAPLAATIHEHSQGNPLFAVEELCELSRNGTLYRDADSGAWAWGGWDVAAVPYSQRLSGIIALRLHRLPEETQKLVSRAACFGRGVEMAQLATITGLAVEELREELAPALREGLLTGANEPGPGAAFRFGHDQIRSAAYAMLDEESRQRTHLEIGTLLLGAKDGESGGLPEAIAHLNAAAPLLRGEGRELWLAGRNLDAARLAGQKAAFADAHGYLLSALAMLSDDCWQHHYELTRDVHLEAARAACLSSAASSALPLVEQLRRFARTTNDEVAALEVAIEALKVLDRFQDAVDVGLEAAARLGVDLPRKPSTLGPMKRLLATHWRISRLGEQGLTRLGRMEDPRARAAMRILSDIGAPCFLVLPALFPAIVDAQLRLSLEFGNAPESAYAYALYAVILAGPLGRVARAHDVGVAALEVLEGADRSQVPRTLMAVYVFVMPWRRPLADCLDVLLEGSRVALEVGDAEFANYHASSYATFSVHAGPTLEAACAQFERQRARIEPLGQQRQYAADIYHQFCLNLRSTEGDPARLAGPIYDEVVDGAAHAGAVEMNGHLHLVHLMLAVTFDRYDDLARSLRGFRESIKAFDGMYVQAAFYFHEALALLRSSGNASAQLHAAIALARLRRWQRHAPENFGHKVTLLAAELARARGGLRRAQALFEEAAIGAERGGFHLEAGLALEGARAVASARGLDVLAQHYADEARRVYEEWGAVAKVRELSIRFGARLAADRTGAAGSGTNRGWDLAPASLDLVGVLEASQALSAGMELEATIRKIMQTVVGLSGARRGVLLSEAVGGFAVLAMAQTDGAALRVDVFPDNDETAVPGSAAPFSASVVREVVQSGRALILSDPAGDPRFQGDPHLRRDAPRALLCCPISHGNRRTAVLYLEHDQRRDAFGQQQMETVRLLSTQAAISLDNARLYARQLRLSNGAQRFVPHEFLLLLGKGDVDEVALSDYVKAEMTIFVCDIRGFTTATETMTPEANFAYINDFFAVVGPAVRGHLGFVMKYMGDGLMAVFPRSPDDAAAAALAITEQLREMPHFRIGIGLHTGSVAVGAVGEHSRLQADVMSDAVTVACRLESLTREPEVPVVLSAETCGRLSPALRERTRPLGRTAVKGRVGSIDIHALE